MKPLSNPQNPMLERDLDEPADLSDRDYAAREARQGRIGRPVLVVLLAGLALAMIAWAGAEFWGESLPGNDTETTQQAPAANSATSQENQVPTIDSPNTSNTQQTPAVDRSPAPQSGSGGGSPQPSPDGTVN